MSDLLVVQNSTREGPGLLESILHEEQITYDLVDLDQGEVFPLVQPYKGVVVLGGPDSANDETPKMLAERGKVEEVLRRQIPYLGICLGLQVMVKAASGQVMKSPVQEVAKQSIAGLSIGFLDGSKLAQQFFFADRCKVGIFHCP